MISARHWLIASGLAVSVHAGAFFAVFYNPISEEGSQGVGSQGIEFGLGISGDLGVAVQTTASQEDVKKIEEPIEDIEEELEPEPIEEAEVVKPEPIIELEPIEEPETVVEPDPIIEPEVIEETEIIEPEVIEETEIIEPEIVEPEPIEVKQVSPIEVKQPDPKPKAVEKPKAVKPPEPIKEKPMVKVAPKMVTVPKATPTPKAKPTSVASPSVANQKATTGTANSASNGGNLGAKASYLTQLASILARNKKYPRASRRRSEEGVVTLTFVVHKDGKVTGVSITKSSGYKRLDKAVLDMIKRSTPLPVFSKDMVEDEIRINLPVSFKLSDLQ